MKSTTWTIVAALVLGVLIWACGKDSLQLNIRYARVDGLKTGDRVILDATTAGRVSRVVYENSADFTVSVVIDPDFSASATEHSRFFIIDDPGQAGRKAVAISLLRPGGAPLADEAVIIGATRTSMLLEKWQAEAEQGLDALDRHFEQLAKDIKEIPLQEAVADMQRMLTDLARTMEQAGKDTRDRIRNDILPKVQREIERLGKALRALGRENEATPLETQLEEIRRV